MVLERDTLAARRWAATPGRHEIEDQVAEGDRVVTRLTAYGTHEGDLPIAPRTGNDLQQLEIIPHMEH